MKIAATGHRPDKLLREYDMRGPLSNWISEQFERVMEEHKPEVCISGMALGVDMIFAATALHRKIPVLAAIPFEGQETKWPDASQRTYWSILNHPLVERKYVCEPGYSSFKMQVRNQFMVDTCNMLIAVWDGTPGGTANCVKYASTTNRNTIFINPNDYNK